MEEERLFCQTPSHAMVLRHKTSRNAENDVLGSPTPARPSGKGEEGLIGGRSALNPLSLNVALTGLGPSLESKAGRQLRTVKRALGSFKVKMKTAGVSGRRAKGARRHLLDLTLTGTPRTPEGVLRLLGSPMLLPADGTPRAGLRYRDPARAMPLLSPATPLDGLRRSARLASRSPTPARVHCRQMPRRLESPGNFINDLNRMTSQLQALTQDAVTALEAMETGLAKSIERQESKSSLGAKADTQAEPASEGEGTAKKELRGKCTGSLTSLRGSLQKRLRKQPSGAELGEDSKAGAKTKSAKSDNSTTATDKGSKAKPLKK